MGTGILAMPVILILIYLIPIGLFFYKTLNKRLRIVLLFIPVIFTLVNAVSIVKEAIKQDSLYRMHPEANKIMFHDDFKNIQDSIKQLQLIMAKLPKRSDHESVSYTIDKSPARLNLFSFNWYDLGNFELLQKEDNLHEYIVPENMILHWKEYMGTDLKPFYHLSAIETRHFISLIKYLDYNRLNAANLERSIISFDYCDSLRMSDNIGFRKIVIDKSGYYGPEFFDIIDSTNGFYLLRKK